MKICENAHVQHLIDNDWKFTDEQNGGVSYYALQTFLFSECKTFEEQGRPELAETIGLLGHGAANRIKREVAFSF